MLNFQRLFFACILCLSLAITSALAEKNRSIDVEIRSLESIAVYPERTAPAVVLGINQTQVSARIETAVIQVMVKVGDQVTKDQPLIKLDCDNFQLALEAEQAQLQSLKTRVRLASKRLKRTRNLRRQESASEETLDQRMTDLLVLQAEQKAQQTDVQKAQLDVDRCTIKSPYHGLVTARHISIGDYVNPGTSLVSLIDLQHVEVSAQLPVSDANQMQETNTLFFEQGDQRFPVVLRQVLPVIDSITRNQEVRLLFTQQNALPGAAGKLIWRDPRTHVLANLLVKRENQFGVYQAKNNQAHFVALPYAQAGRSSPIDLPLSAQLIVKGQYALSDGESLETQ